MNAYNGVRLVDPDLYDVIRVLGGKRKDEIIHVCFPASFPAVFAGLQISLSAAWTCVLAAELMNSRDGLGFLIKRGMDTHQPSLVLSGHVADRGRGLDQLPGRGPAGAQALPLEAQH